MQDSTLKQRAETALIALGDTAEKIAQTLLSGGWHGRRHDSGACPIALYLMTVLPGVLGVVVGSNEATIYPASDGDPDIDVDLTAAVAGFVLAFDVRAYPKLITQDGDDNSAVVPDI